MNDDILIEKLKTGDRAAFDVLVSAHAERVLNTCFKFFQDKTDAEDISQEVFIEVFRSVKSFRVNSKLSTWIYRIAVTKCLDELKKRKRKRRFAGLAKIIHLDDVRDFIGGGKMPDSDIHEKDRLMEIMEALDTLPDNQRIAFTLSKVEGYTSKEIAEIMNTTTVAVDSLVSHAKKKTCKKLEKLLKGNI